MSSLFDLLSENLKANTPKKENEQVRAGRINEFEYYTRKKTLKQCQCHN
jgi:hypothetical protein